MQTFRAQMGNVGKRMLGQALDTVLPPRCVVSGDVVEEQGMISGEAWGKLDFIADPMCACCGFPFDFAVEEGSMCTDCLTYAPPFEAARAAVKYGDVSRDVILGFKHADKTHLVKAFVPWLKRAGAEMLNEADVIVPVPLHYRRLVARRYNQAALIAQALGRETDVECDVEMLRRVRSTASQGHLSVKERFRNVKKAFAVRDKTSVQGKTVVLVDDVYTTGATAKECAKVLLKAGAERVYVLALARVVRE